MSYENGSGTKTSRNIAGVCLCWLVCSLACCSCDVKKDHPPEVGNPASTNGAGRSRVVIPLPPISQTVIVAERSESRMSSFASSFSLTASTNSPVSIASQPPPTKRGTVRLAWSASPDASVVSYRIFYGTNSGSYFSSALVGNVTSVTLSGLDEGTTYYAAATGVNTNGVESSFSNETSFTTGIYISMQQYIWSISAYGLVGRTNQIKTSTNLLDWWTILEWSGDSRLTNVLHTNTSKAWFRVEAK